MQSDTIRVQTEDQNSQAASVYVSTASLSAQMPGIHEVSAWGRLREIRHQAYQLFQEAGQTQEDTDSELIKAQMIARKSELIHIMDEAKERIHMIMEWNDEKAREVDDYLINTPFLDVFERSEIKARQAVFRSIANSIRDYLKS